ncbi:MAG: sugar phosphate isomerase/epimerase family protein [Opitutaceae bacterium]
MKPVLALSSCWLSHRHQDGFAMAKEIASLGFEYAELSHGIRITLVPGILRAVEEGVVKITSTHNFCPLPAGVSRAAPNLFQPSALDHEEHDQWLRHTKRSIDFAAQVKARVIVCHLGSVSFFWFNPSRKLSHYLEANPEAGRSGTDAKYTALLRKSLAKIRDRLPRYFDQVKASIREVLDHARQRGVTLGFENRERFDELPLDDAFDDLFSSLPADAPVGYWHDTGHADIKEGMGLLRHRPHLERLAPRLLGWHLHDVNAEGDDHQAIGEGKIDFQMISEFWRPEHLLTLELSPRLKPEQVASAKTRIEELRRQRFGA